MYFGLRIADCGLKEGTCGCASSLSSNSQSAIRNPQSKQFALREVLSPDNRSSYYMLPTTCERKKEYRMNGFVRRAALVIGCTLGAVVVGCETLPKNCGPNGCDG